MNIHGSCFVLTVIGCKCWLISCEIGCCAKRQSIIASCDNYDTYDVLTHESGNMQMQTLAASTCKVYPLLGGWQTVVYRLISKSYTECSKKLQWNIVTSLWTHSAPCGYCVYFVRLMSMGSSKKSGCLDMLKFGQIGGLFHIAICSLNSSIFIWWL